MNILITPDVPEWAIGRLTTGIIKHNNRFNFFMIPVHPRGVADGFREISQLLKDTRIDLWHGMYWNSALKLIEVMPQLKELPSVLSHHNHHCLEKSDWDNFDTLVGVTDYSMDKIKHDNKFQVHYGIDLDDFSFIDEYPPKEPRVGYVGRVVPWKNLDKITAVADDLGYKVLGTGYIEKIDYWNSIYKENLEFNGGFGRGQIPPVDFKNELYRKMTCFVMFSTGEKETGTLPLLEAMARGVPVLATEQGHARDIIKDGENGIIFDETNFKEKLKLIMEDKKLQVKLRNNAWQTIKNFTEEKMAREYAKIYYKTLYKDKSLVSVIIPTFNRLDALLEILASIEAQSYEAKEIIVCDDGSDEETMLMVKECKKKLKTPILYLRTGDKSEYGLAKARNMGAIEALGDILLFLDDRYTLEPDCLKQVAKHAPTKHWNFGQKMIKGKPSTKKSFIENFSWIRRNEFMQYGMFNERINQYGGMSQEVRHRFNMNGFKFEQIKTAKVRQIKKSPKHKKRDEVWRMKLLLKKIYG